MSSAQEIASWLAERIVGPVLLHPVKALRRAVRRRRIRGALKLTGWLDRRRWAPA